MTKLQHSYPLNGSRYVLSTQVLEDGKPVGERGKAFESDDKRSIAAWFYRRGVKLL